MFFPGGFGTLDEFFEMLVLIQTKKAQPVPMVCVGKEFWEPLMKYVDEVIVKKFKVAEVADTKLYVIVDSAEAAFKIVESSSERTFF